MMRLLVTRLLTILFPTSCYLCHKESCALCASCIHQFKKPIRKEHEWIYSLFSYSDPRVKKIIHAIKFFHRKDILHPIIYTYAHTILETIPQTKDWVLVPIPMPPLRKYIRGYNQSEYIAKEIHNITHIPLMYNLLKRKKYTKRQVTSQTRKERLSQQLNSFSCTKTPPPFIILIDDVTTTGATLVSAKEELIRSGASCVIGITLAH